MRQELLNLLKRMHLLLLLWQSAFKLVDTDEEKGIVTESFKRLLLTLFRFLCHYECVIRVIDLSDFFGALWKSSAISMWQLVFFAQGALKVLQCNGT